MRMCPQPPARESCRNQCRDTVQEYEESMRVWEEMKDIGDLCTSDTDSEEEDELTSDDLLGTLEKMSVAASPTGTPKAESSNIDWPKRVLRQTILVLSIAAEIEADIGRADWDKSCIEECRKLLQLEIAPTSVECGRLGFYWLRKTQQNSF